MDEMSNRVKSERERVVERKKERKRQQSKFSEIAYIFKNEASASLTRLA